MAQHVRSTVAPTPRAAVGFGSSFGGNPLEQHIGIGTANRISEVTVQWPASGIVDRVANVASDRQYTLLEGEGKLLPFAKQDSGE